MQCAENFQFRFQHNAIEMAGYHKKGNETRKKNHRGLHVIAGFNDARFKLPEICSSGMRQVNLLANRSLPTTIKLFNRISVNDKQIIESKSSQTERRTTFSTFHRMLKWFAIEREKNEALKFNKLILVCIFFSLHPFADVDTLCAYNIICSTEMTTKKTYGEKKRQQISFACCWEKKKFDYIGFNMRNQTHDPEINGRAGRMRSTGKKRSERQRYDCKYLFNQ